MKINLLWNFNEAVKNIKTMKQEYYDVLSSFSIYDTKKEVKYKQDTRKQIYSFSFDEWKKDKLWEFMNGDVPYSMLLQLRNGQK